MLSNVKLLPDNYKLKDNEVSTRDDELVAYLAAPSHGSGLVQLFPKGAIPNRRNNNVIDFEWVYEDRHAVYFYMKNIWVTLKHEFKPYSTMCGKVYRLKDSLRRQVNDTSR